MGYFCKSFRIRAVQIFRLYHQNCLIFEKISARDNRSSSNFEIASTNLPYFCENFRSWQEKVRYSSHIKKTAFILPTFYPAIIEPVQFSSDIKSALFLRKYQLVMQGQVKYSNHFNKTALFLQKFQPVIIGAVRIFRLHKICHILSKFSS